MDADAYGAIDDDLIFDKFGPLRRGQPPCPYPSQGHELALRRVGQYQIDFGCGDAERKRKGLTAGLTVKRE